MARRTKPFEQYSTRVPDGRTVVGAVAFEPIGLHFWVVGRSRGEVLSLLRERGVPAPHVVSEIRPGARLAGLAAADPEGFVFVPDPHQWFPRDVYSSGQLAGFLADPERPLLR
jgi:hypothetical protein